MRQADLPKLGVTLLGTEQIGHPDAGAMARHHLGDHAGGTAVANDVDHHLIVLEHPVPVCPAIDPHRGLVRADQACAAQPGEDGGNLGVEARLGTAEHGIQRALADLQGEQVQEQPAEALVADGVGSAQVDRQRHDVETEWRALLHALRHGCQGDAAAARAMAGIAFHPGHHRPHRRQVYFVIAAVQHLIGVVERCLAMRADQRLGGHRLIRIACQGPAAALATETALAGSLAFAPVRLVGLLALGRRQAGVVRRLGRAVEPGLQFGKALLRCMHALPQRQDQRVFLGVAQSGEVWERGHPKLESSRP